MFDLLLHKRAKEIKQDTDKFSDEHPVAMALIVGMGAVIFAQHVELKCYKIMMAAR